VLYITHDLATAYYMSDRIAIMFRGDIVEMGTVEQVLMAPKHPYTKLLRESIPEADPARRWVGEIKLSDTEQDEYLKQGCRFAGRCPLVMDICRHHRRRRTSTSRMCSSNVSNTATAKVSNKADDTATQSKSKKVEHTMTMQQHRGRPCIAMHNGRLKNASTTCSAA
jgi:oligopeptide/dipeptide ABC transporter ATP-binding protein